MTSWGLGNRSLWGAVLLAACAAAAEPASTEFFEKNIRPVLVDHCYECHGGDPAKIKGDLNLTYRDGMLQGGENGPALVPGDVANSRLLKALHYDDKKLQMPPTGKLADNVVADFATWIAQGAIDPRDMPPSDKELQENRSWEKVRTRRMAWWSFQPVTHPSPPEVSDIFPLMRAGTPPRAASTRATRSLTRRPERTWKSLPPSPPPLTISITIGAP